MYWCVNWNPVVIAFADGDDDDEDEDEFKPHSHGQFMSLIILSRKLQSLTCWIPGKDSPKGGEFI